MSKKEEAQGTAHAKGAEAKDKTLTYPGRRRFITKVGGITAATMAAGAMGLPLLEPRRALARTGRALNPGPRRNAAFQVRLDTATAQRNLPLPRHLTNGDESLLPNRIGSFSKTLPHNSLGEVDPVAYNLYLNAVTTGRPADFESIPLGGTVRLANPQGGLAFALEGADSHHLPIITPPAFSSAWEASEMVELYWQALTRDVPFLSFETDPMIAQAAAELSAMSDFRGPKSGGAVTVGTLFRGETPGDLTGPYISQFLWKDIPYGPTRIVQRNRTTIAGDDQMTSYDEWLNIQRGVPPSKTQTVDGTARYIRNGRDLAEWDHLDFTYQGFLNAALILLSFGTAALDDFNPYKGPSKQGGFTTFGAAHILDLVARAGNAAVRAAWCPKWFVHRRLRPDAFGGRVHNHINGAASYPIHPEVLNSRAASAVFSKTGNYLLPMAYAEGSPAHPSYPAGHAVIAGAGTTVLKAFFNESFVIPNPVQANADGTALEPLSGITLTVGGELNKLAANVAIGRDTAGVHWRTDGVEGLRLGEEVALAILRDERETFNEDFVGFSLTKFDGSTTNV